MDKNDTRGNEINLLHEYEWAVCAVSEKKAKAKCDKAASTEFYQMTSKQQIFQPLKCRTRA